MIRWFSSRRDILALGLIAAVVVLTAGIFLGLMFLTDPVDDYGCPTKHKVGHAIVLIDKTDAFNVAQQRILTDLIERFKSDLQWLALRDKLSIYVLDDTNYVRPRPMFSACRPKSDSEVNELIEDRYILKSEFEQKYASRLQVVLTEVLKGTKTATTPLLEMLREISVLPDFGHDLPARRLVIFSDMIHNTPEWSMYRESKVKGATLSFERAEQENATYFRRVRPIFNGQISVWLYILRRQTPATALTWDRVQDFWGTYFESAGVRFMTEEVCPPRDHRGSCVYVEP